MSSFLSGRPSTCPTVRRRRLTLVSVLLVPLVVMAGLSGLAPRAQAVYASTEGGAGSYPQEIDWMNWDTSQFAAGSTTTQWSTPTRIEGSDMWRAIRCTLAVDATAGLFSYTPGSWRADGLARLCNDGTNYTDGRENRPRPAANQQTVTGSGLQIGLASRYRQTPSFHVSCTSYVLQDPGGQWTRPTQADLDAATKTEIPSAGMVVADAESSNWRPGNEEYYAVAPVAADPTRPVSFHHLESTRGDGCQVSSVVDNGFTFTSGGAQRTGIRVRTDGTGCEGTSANTYMPTSVILMSGAASFYGYLQGSNASAVAVGVVSAIDVGDAPQSYGGAASAYQPTWSGGELGTAPTVNLTAMQQAGDRARPQGAATTLGVVIDPEVRQLYSSDATGDDASITSHGGASTDEEAVLEEDRSYAVEPGRPFLLTVACTGDGAVQGWIDWDRSGAFEAEAARAEASDQATCTGDRARLTWNVPADAQRSVQGEADSAPTFMRIRIAADPAQLAPTGLSASGEVEDYRIDVRVAELTLAAAPTWQPAGDQAAGVDAGNWALSAQSGDGTEPGTRVTDRGLVRGGEFVLGARPADNASPEAAGFMATGWTCQPTQGRANPDYRSTLNEDAGSYTAVILNGDAVTCTLALKAVPATVTWSKTDDEGNAVAGASFTLTPAQGGALQVEDCLVDGCAGPDTDPRPGFFSVTGLPWGTTTVAEAAAPAGYVASTRTGSVSLTGADATLTDGSPVVLTGDRPTALDAERVVKGDVGAFVNTPQAGTLTWAKTDADSGELLGVSVWELSGTGTHTGRAVAIEVTDCAVGAGGVCAPDSRDQDPVAGSFRVPGMALGSYTLTETTAPTGYDRLGEPVVAQITAADQVTDYGALANARTAEPTGGASASSSPAVGASASGGAMASGGPAVSAGATAGRPSASARSRPGLAATGVAAPAMLLGGLGAALLGGAAELARRRMNRR